MKRKAPTKKDLQQAGANSLDPLERCTFVLPKSMADRLTKLVYESKDKTNKSKLVREALEEKYAIS